MTRQWRASFEPGDIDRGAPSWRVHATRLTLLTLVVVLPRLLVIERSVAPARDALRFVHAAQIMETVPFARAAREIECHPLYPATLLRAKWIYTAVTGADGPDAWIRAGELWSVACFTCFLLTAYGAGTCLWNGRIAFWGCLATAALPRPMSYSVDVLSDNLHAVFWMGCVGLLAWNWRRPATWKGIGAGVAAGLAYWTRLEGLTLGLLFAGTLALTQARGDWRWPWRQVALATLEFAVPFLLLVAAYANTVGGLSVRKVAGTMLAPNTLASANRAARNVEPSVEAPPSERVPWISENANQVDLARVNLVIPMHREYRGYERTSLGTAALLVAREIGEETRIWLLAFLPFCLFRRGRSRLWFPGGWLVCLSLLGIVVLLLFMKTRAGYFSGRYGLPVLPFLAMLAMTGAERSIEVARKLPRARGEHAWSARRFGRARGLAAVGVIFALALALCLPGWLRPMHESHHGHRMAARWLREHSEPGDVIFDHSGMCAFFAQRESWEPNGPVPPRLPIRYAVLDVSLLDRTGEPALTVIHQVHETGRLAAEFPKRPGSPRAGVYIFAIPAHAPDHAAPPAKAELR